MAISVSLNTFNSSAPSRVQTLKNCFENLGWKIISQQSSAAPSLIQNPYTKRYWAFPLLEILSQAKAEADILVGLIEDEIYTPGLLSIFGQCLENPPSIIISTGSLSADGKSENLSSRLKAMLLHEAGHIAGLEHCKTSTCPMSRTLKLKQLDQKENGYCNKCVEILKSKKPEIDSEDGLRLLEEIIKNKPAPKKKLSEKPRFVYSDDYYADIGVHVFPIEKFQVLHRKMLKSGIFKPEDIIEPEQATWEDLSVLLEPGYIEDLKQGKLTHRTIRSELPIDREGYKAWRLAAGGTHLAGKVALESGLGFNLSGGFHHAYEDHAEGFCYINDVAYAVRKLKKDKEIKKAAIIDLDLHQGNGTAFIFRNDDDVFTFSMHQERNYPMKEESDLDIGLDDGVGDEVYLGKMRRNVPSILEFHQPDTVFYLAGADPYEHDQLGGLKLTFNGLLHRDQMVVEECKKRGVPLVIVLAGGYAFNFEDTIEIHFNTIKSAWAAWK